MQVKRLGLRIKKRVVAMLMLTLVMASVSLFTGEQATARAIPDCHGCCENRWEACYGKCQWWNVVCISGCNSASTDCHRVCDCEPCFKGECEDAV
jgi:hypothetical protein